MQHSVPALVRDNARTALSCSSSCSRVAVWVGRAGMNPEKDRSRDPLHSKHEIGIGDGSRNALGVRGLRR